MSEIDSQETLISDIIYDVAQVPMGVSPRYNFLPNSIMSALARRVIELDQRVSELENAGN